MPSESPQNPRGNGPYAIDEPDVNPEGQTLYPLKLRTERPSAEVFPYRGVETHGVHPSRSVDPPEHMDEGGMVQVAPPKKAPEPVPVRLVEPGIKAYKQWRAIHEFVGASARQVVNRKENRQNLRIKNLTAGKNPNTGKGCWLGPDSGVNAMNGYFLDAGDIFALSGEAEVWGISEDPVELVELAIAFEFETGML